MKLLWCFLLVASVPVWAQSSPTINDSPSREFGTAKLITPPTSDSPNLLEGREFSAPTAIAFSPSGGVLYVADTNNNRVLAWLNPAGLTAGNQADKVIGQRDFYSDLANGPGTSFSSGLRSPVSVAVDGGGNLYVLDAGNNRIVRYPNPFTQTSDPLSIDLVIGQKTQSSGNLANEGQPKPSSKTLSFSSGSTLFTAGMAFDSTGNLWVTDPGNHRVLRFLASQLAAGTIEPVADLVLGQADFISNTAPSCGNTCQTNLSVLLRPQSLAFDGAGALYVADGYARVLYYPTPGLGIPASKVLGVVPASAGTARPNDYSLGNSLLNSQLGVFASGNAVFVADAVANRVVRYTTPAQFTPSPTAPSPKIEGVVGQADLFSGESNRVKFHEPSASSLSFPAGGAIDSAGNLWVVDLGNSRVLSYPASGSFSYTSATVVVGQTDFPFRTPNLIEGREVWTALRVGSQIVPGGGMVVDKSSDPPHLYIADTYNNRVLGFRDARVVGTDTRSLLTQKADLVIGQPDLFRAMVNYPGGDPDLPTQTGLLRPVGLAVDDSGNLWVADSGNGRALRFPAPFSVAPGIVQSADLVLGQSSFTQKDQSASQQTMNAPYGLALFPDGHLAVSDVSLNRVLTFRKPFSNGQTAFTVVGQPNFVSSGSSNSLAGLNAPRHVATDSVGRLYVNDSANNRLIVFRDTSNIQQTGPSAAFNFPVFTQPQGIAVSATSGEIWIAAGATIFHLPEVTTFQNTSKILQQIPSNTPMAIALDSFENPIVAEAINRIAFYFAKLTARNGYSFTSTRPLTPGVWVQGYPKLGQSWGVANETQGPPYDKSLAGLQLLVNGTPAAISAIGKDPVDFINFNVPWSAPTSGTAEFLLYKPGTGQIVAAGNFLMAVADPAFKTVNGAGFGQILANNEDGTRNGPQSPIGLGKILTLALTGEGLLDNPPPDGTAPGNDSIQTNPVDLHVFINGKDVNTSGGNHILYSGLDPTFPGSWTINVRIPDVSEGGPPPSNAVPILVIMKDIPSNYGFDPNNSANDILLQVSNGRITTIAVK